MTVDAFKCWAMMSKTETGKQVRQYFLECERLLKEQYNSLSPCELILKQAQQLVNVERRQLKVEREQKEMKIEQAKMQQLLIQHDSELDRVFNANGHYYTIMGYCSLIGKPIAVKAAAQLGRKATQICRQLGLDIVPIKDPRFGQVNSYPESVLTQIV